MLGLIIRTIYILFGSCYIFCDSFGKAFLLFLGQAFTILPRCCMVPFIYITSLHLLVHIFLSCIFLVPRFDGTHNCHSLVVHASPCDLGVHFPWFYSLLIVHQVLPLNNERWLKYNMTSASKKFEQPCSNHVNKHKMASSSKKFGFITIPPETSTC